MHFKLVKCDCILVYREPKFLAFMPPLLAEEHSAARPQPRIIRLVDLEQLLAVPHLAEVDYAVVPVDRQVYLPAAIGGSA